MRRHKIWHKKYKKMYLKKFSLASFYASTFVHLLYESMCISMQTNKRKLRNYIMSRSSIFLRAAQHNERGIKVTICSIKVETQPVQCYISRLFPVSPSSSPGFVGLTWDPNFRTLHSCARGEHERNDRGDASFTRVNKNLDPGQLMANTLTSTLAST